MDRRDKVLQDLNLSGLGLEIGAGYSPVAAGDPALNVRTLDHLDTAALVEKYSVHDVDVGLIQPVDYVWSGQRYRDLVGETRFDWIIASHVIEHVPDMVGFINECGEILTEDGVLSLVIPDKRFCFDYFRPPTGLSRFVDAHIDGRRISSPGSVAELFINFARLEDGRTWSWELGGEPQAQNRHDKALHGLGQVSRGEYVDTHAWVFTPHSLRLAVHDLHKLELLQLRERSFSDTAGNEFFLQLSRGGGGEVPDRHTLTQRALREMSTHAGAEPPIRPPPPPDLRPEVEALQAVLADIQGSTSWRVTAPLRALKRMFDPRA